MAITARGLALAVGCTVLVTSACQRDDRKADPSLQDAAGHHLTEGAVRIPLPIVDQAQLEIQDFARPCIVDARGRGIVLDATVRVESTLQVNRGQATFHKTRLDRPTEDPMFDRCVVAALAEASYPAVAPEGAIATFSGIVRTTRR